MHNIFMWFLCFLLACLPSKVDTTNTETSLFDIQTSANSDAVHYSYIANELRKHSVVMEVLTPVDIGGNSPIFIWRKIGSGTLVNINGEPNILTAWHVALASLEVPMRACPVLASKDNCVDLVLPWLTEMSNNSLSGDWAFFQLRSTPEGMTPARIRHRGMSVGESIYIMGSPAHEEGLLTSGIVSGFATEEDGTNLIQTDAFVYYGSSGGGLFDRTGLLIGVVVALSAPNDDPLPHINFSVPLTHIVEFIKEK